MSDTTQLPDVDPNVQSRLEDVRGRIASACDQADRPTSAVTMVAVTKYATADQARSIVSLGVRDLGENYVQNLQQRAVDVGEHHQALQADASSDVNDDLRWHLQGHLQRNKVKAALPIVTMLHTLDSLRLAEELEVQVPRVLGEEAKLPCLMQINCSNESQKGGVAVGAARHLAEQMMELGHLRLMGVMTMAAYGVDADTARRTFARCREVFEEMKKFGIGGDDFRHLSMGMSDDFEPAILEGSTIIRVGSALFGAREEAA
ncbi:MAG: YggS family pyridoxal phosphate-dependent enzyme [Planctomycetota bacterium]